MIITEVWGFNTKMNSEDLYLKCQSIINHYIKKYSSLDRDEIQSLSNEIFMQCIKRYKNEKKATFKTYFSACLGKTLSRQWKKHKNGYKSIFFTNEDRIDPYEARIIWGEPIVAENIIVFRDSIEKTSKNAKDIISVCLNNPPELISCCRKKNGITIDKKGISKYFKDKKLKSTYEIKIGLKEIRKTLKQGEIL